FLIAKSRGMTFSTPRANNDRMAPSSVTTSVFLVKNPIPGIVAQCYNHCMPTPIKFLVKKLRHMWRFIKKHIWSVVLWGMAAGFAFAGLFMLWAATLQIPDLSSLENRVIQQSVNIYDRTGTVLLYDLNNNARRTVVPLANISPYIQDATISIEDPTFYENSGIRPTSIIRAILADIMAGGKVQGGSTLTQQVVKVTMLTNDKSITRKIKEWVLALKLTRTLTKNQILEIYLNQIPYGGNLYGVEETAQTFFGKHASDLDLAESAYMAAVLPAPSYYSPYGYHKDDLDKRKDLVLQKMLEHGFISEEQMNQAKAEDVVFQKQRTTSITAPHFVFYVQQYLEDKYGTDILQQGGWKIITTLDADLQAQAQATVQKWALSNTKNYNASNAGLVAMDPNTGQILSMIGSRNYFDPAIEGNFNIALAERQPGSAFKPFAYAEALVKGYTPDTVVFDVPTQFSTTCAADNFTSTNGCYSPGNYDGNFRGPMTLRDALAQSINVPAVKALYLAGINDTLQLAKSMGVSSLTNANQYGLTLVLGGGEVTLLDMTNAYGTFAANGIHHPTTAILKITDSNGNVVEDNSQPSGSQILPPGVAENINSMLSDPVARAPLGENSIVSFPGHDVAVKTGTTNNYRDAWTIGYTPNLVVGVWAGNNDNTPMVKKVSGFIVGPMWHDVMTYALDKYPNVSFTTADIPSTEGIKPALAGNWQIPGNDGSIHEILYWVDKNNPTGAPPSNPWSDGQFHLWDPPVMAWAAAHGIGVPTTATTTDPNIPGPIINNPGVPIQPGIPNFPSQQQQGQ
ncbi:MAG: putative penicillin-binding protein, partial [Candidatus Adlerbacteria bacterium]|nr:putative penicillin-binding protein [Candidatus Adlerbacteria bacterium]